MKKNNPQLEKFAAIVAGLAYHTLKNGDMRRTRTSPKITGNLKRLARVVADRFA